MENPTQLTMADMASLATIIEVACKRGAFRAEEMTAIGTVYDKLRQFVSQDLSNVAPTAQDPDTEVSQDPQGESHA